MYTPKSAQHTLGIRLLHALIILVMVVTSLSLVRSSRASRPGAASDAGNPTAGLQQTALQPTAEPAREMPLAPEGSSPAMEARAVEGAACPVISAPSPAIVTGGSTVEFSVIVSHPDGVNAIKRIYFGFAPCQNDPAPANYSNFERYLARYLGVVYYPVDGWGYVGTTSGSSYGCTGGGQGTSPWTKFLGRDPNLSNATGTMKVTHVGWIEKGNMRKFTWTVELADDLPLGVYSYYAMAEDVNGNWQTCSSTAQWQKLGELRTTPSIFGAEIQANINAITKTSPLAQQANISWVRYNGICWSKVQAEKVKAEKVKYDQAALAEIDKHLSELSSRGLTPIVILRGTPTWAQREPKIQCGPIKEENFDDFAAFAKYVVSRYKDPPYNVKYWEIWNEPDSPWPITVTEEFTQPCGCWGDTTDEEGFGGGYFADMLKKVYPAIKQADPSAQVVLGGLLLSCDDVPEGGDFDNCPQPDLTAFLKGILENGGGDYFDIAAFHAYTYWWPPTEERPVRDWDFYFDNTPTYSSRGGFTLAKLEFVRNKLAEYGITNKPILMNEGGIICKQQGYEGDWYYPICSSYTPPEDFQNAQANTVIRLYTRGWANGIQAVSWYTLHESNWNHTGLLDGNKILPGYNSLRFLATKLKGATYIGKLHSNPVIFEGYRFRKGGTEYHIYWTNQAADPRIPVSSLQLPGVPVVAYNYLGQPISVPPDFGFEPILLQFALDGQDQLILQPGPGEGMDTYVDQANPDTAYGDADACLIGKRSTGEYPGGPYRSLLKFDLTQVPPGSIVTAAILEVYIRAYEGSNTFQLYRATSAWGEGATWNTQPAYDSSKVWGRFSSTEGNTYVRRKIDVTDIVSRWHDGTHTNYGFYIVGSDESDWSRQYLYTSDGGNASYRPKLTVYTYPSANQVIDPGFESSGHWSEQQLGPFPATSFWRSTWGIADEHGGSHAYAISNLAYGQLSSDAIAVGPNTQYDLSAYVRGELNPNGSGGSYAVRANFYDASGNHISRQNAAEGYVSNLTTSWQYLGGRVTAPGGAATMRVALLNECNSGWIAFDDVAAFRVGTSANLVTNPGFESSGHWSEQQLGPFPATSFWRSTWGIADEHGGSYAYAISNLAYGQLSSDAIAVSPNTQYDLAAYVRGELDPNGSGGSYAVRANFYDASGNHISRQNAAEGYVSNLTTSWQYLGGRVTAPGGAATMRVTLLNECNSGWIAFDDVAAFEVGTSANLVTNPGFESSGHWSEQQLGPFPATSFWRSTWGIADERSGSYAYAISNLAYGQLSSDAIAVSPNTQYDLAAYVRGELDPNGSGGSYAVRANFYDASGNHIGRQNVALGYVSNLTTSWQYLGGRVTAPGNAATMRVTLLNECNSGWIAFDDVIASQSFH